MCRASEMLTKTSGPKIQIRLKKTSKYNVSSKNLNFDLLAVVGDLKWKFWVGKKMCNDPTTSNVSDIINGLPTTYYKVYT